MSKRKADFKQVICPICGKEFATNRNDKRYCSQECQAVKIKPKQPKTCVICETTFVPNRSDTKYCSDDCRKTAYSKKVVHTPKNCKWCGKEFTPKFKQFQAYCCKPCKRRADLERNRERIYEYQCEYKRKKRAENPKSKRRDTKRRIIDGVERARCSTCKQWLPLDMFYKKASVSDGLNTQCKNCIREYDEANKERISEYQAKYREINAEKLKQYSKEYEEKLKHNPEYQERRKKYFKKLRADPEYQKRRKKWFKEYYQRPEARERMRNLNLKKRTLRKKAIATLTIEEWQECLEYFDHKDAYTGLPMEIISQDHVLAVSKGGGYTASNIIPCEKSINSSKGNRNIFDWYPDQPFYSEARLRKILKWTGLKPDSEVQQLPMF